MITWHLKQLGATSISGVAPFFVGIFFQKLLDKMFVFHFKSSISNDSIAKFAGIMEKSRTFGKLLCYEAGRCADKMLNQVSCKSLYYNQPPKHRLVGVSAFYKLHGSVNTKRAPAV